MCVCVGVCVGGVEVGGGTVVEPVVAAAVVAEEEEVLEKEGVFSSAISVTNISCPPYILK